MLDVIFLRPDDEVRNPFLLKSYNHRQSRALMRLGLTLIISAKWGWVCGCQGILSLLVGVVVQFQIRSHFSFHKLLSLILCLFLDLFFLLWILWVWNGLGFSPGFMWMGVFTEPRFSCSTCSAEWQLRIYYMFQLSFFFFCLLDDERATVDTQICKVKLGVSSSPEPVLQFEWLQSSVISFPATRWLSP